MRAAVIYGVSIAVHLGFAGVVATLKKPVRKDRVAVTIREIKKAPPKPEHPEPPPPPPKPKKAAAPKVATAQPKPAAPPPAPLRAASAPAPSAPVADFGLTLASGDGPAIARPPSAERAAPKPEAETRHAPKPKVLAAGAPEEDEGCAEPPVKPKPLNVVQPAYTDDARAAQIEGKVRVEITVGPDGTVTDVKILQGLGHGLDEAALEAARGSTFEPGSRCGKPVATTFTIGMRFSL